MFSFWLSFVMRVITIFAWLVLCGRACTVSEDWKTLVGGNEILFKVLIIYAFNPMLFEVISAVV